MNKLAAFLFWGTFAFIAFFVSVVWLAGHERNSSTPDKQTCTTHAAALRAADDANRKMVGDPSDYEQTNVLFNDEAKGVRVGLVYRANGKAGRAASYTVGADCRIVGIN